MYTNGVTFLRFHVKISRHPETMDHLSLCRMSPTQGMARVRQVFTRVPMPVERG